MISLLFDLVLCAIRLPVRQKPAAIAMQKCFSVLPIYSISFVCITKVQVNHLLQCRRITDKTTIITALRHLQDKSGGTSQKRPAGFTRI